MTEDVKIEIINGQIKEVIEPKVVSTRPVYTVVRKQEMYGAGDTKAYQTMVEELKAVNGTKKEKSNKMSDLI